MLKNIVKYGVRLVVIMLIAAGILYGIQYWRYKTSPEYKAIKDFEALKKQYAEDPYGGDTPEETLRLFIDALKKGNTDLAAKYFTLDQQQKWREDLAKIKEKGLLNAMIRDLGRAQLTKQTERAFVTLMDENNIVQSEMIIHKNTLNSKWKITEL